MQSDGVELRDTFIAEGQTTVGAHAIKGTSGGHVIGECIGALITACGHTKVGIGGHVIAGKIGGQILTGGHTSMGTNLDIFTISEGIGALGMAYF